MRGTVALIASDRRDGETVVAVRGELDVGTAPALRDWLDRASDGGRSSVTLDLRRVGFLAISGVYVLCDEQQRMAAHRARLTIVCDDRRILQLFSVCRLEAALYVVSAHSTAATAAAWSSDDDARTERLGEWLRRYTAESA